MVKISGKRVVPHGPQELWRLLMSAEVLRKCMEGCEEFEEVAPGKYRVALKVGFGPVKGRFRGEVELKDVVELKGYRLEMQAKGTMGFLRGATRVELAPLDGGGSTEIAFESEAQVGGVLASVGSRFVEGAARSYIDSFFAELSKL
jgi:hypothetical protein